MAGNKLDNEKVKSSNLFPVVGIGASAGGLDAFRRMLKVIPEKSGMAYILVQHLDPAHDSILAELLQKVTKIPVQEITDNVEVEPDNIYIIPANNLLTATDGVLQLSPRLAKLRNLSIDLFFESLAEVHQEHAIGVVLSGTQSDGTLGLKAIKNQGGITFAQEPESAAYDAMPKSAIDAGVVDFILPPEKIPAQLLALQQSLEINPEIKTGGKEPAEENGFRQIISLIRLRKGVDFTHYKQATIRRRITRRIALSMKTDLTEYLLYLSENKTEQDILFQDLLIPVTQFFRDPKVFDILCETVFPTILKQRDSADPLRIWIAGCSTGEEAYSIVMCLHECLGDKLSVENIQVFATDISEKAIVKARTGLYKKSEVEGLSPARLKRFFTITDGQYRVNKSIRDACVFAFHNFLKDPPFARMDMVCCRNSLIYLEPVLQKKALTTFHYALKEKGFLVLGKSETVGQALDLYTNFDKNSKIYTRKPVRGRFLHMMADRNENQFKGAETGSGRTEPVKDDFQKNADDLLLAHYTPAGVIVNSDLDIVQFRGATGVWLEASPGKPSLNVLKMVREGLAFELRNALHKVQSSKKTIAKENIPIQFMGGERLVTIEVIPLLNTIDLYFLILFKDSALPVSMEADATAGNGAAVTSKKMSKERLQIKKIQLELAQAREDMRSITEDQEASNEELQSANEELLSGSEEMQSLNEELETSKEETQTSNEELIVVNQELYDRNEQLNLSRLYAESIVTTIREPLIILDKNLQVKTANRAFYNRFQTDEEGTEGKSFFDLGKKQWNTPELRNRLEKVLPDKTSIVDFEVSHNFPAIGERVMVLNASRIVRDNNEDQSILLAIEDITEKKRAENELKNVVVNMEQQIIERTSSLNEANTDLSHSNKSLEQFAYIASHDLQEPLRKIRVFSTALEDRYKKELPDAAQELISKITTSAERMTTLIKDVLNFSKVLHDDMGFEKTNLNNILTNVLQDFDLLVTEKKAVINWQNLPVIEAIPLQMNQLFNNLISNSLKFSVAEKIPVITITSQLLTLDEVLKYKTLNKNLVYCQINFKDNGIGFEQQYAEQVFLVFKRLHGRKQYTGTGIGLALCKSIVVKHHGEINAVSTLGDGTLFQLILPLYQK